MQPDELNGSLVMRNATEADIPALLEHFRIVHGEGVLDEMEAMLKHYPRFSWDNSFIIEDSESRAVVSCIILLQNAWVLDDIEFSSVEMEAVGTLEAYRYRGLIRLLNKPFENQAAQLQPAIQAIAGIPYFYRNFGYVYAASLGGGYSVNPALIPKLKGTEAEPVTFQPVDSQNFKDFLRFRGEYVPSGTWTRSIRPEDSDYLIFDASSHKQEAFFFYLVKEKGKTVGVFFLARWENRIDIAELYLNDHQHADAVMRFALTKAQEWNGIPVRVTPPNQVSLREHIAARTQTRTVQRYAWYVKIPSISRFIMILNPLFKKRLQNTEFEKFTGDLNLTTYKEGLTLSFERGVFKEIRENQEKDLANYHMRIPMDSLTRLLMGYESLDELMEHEPDVSCAAIMRPLVRLLFPRLEAMVDPFY